MTAPGYNTDYIGILGLGYSVDFAHSFVNRWALTTGNEAVAIFNMAYDESDSTIQFGVDSTSSYTQIGSYVLNEYIGKWSLNTVAI